jgi:hypothetical protein
MYRCFQDTRIRLKSWGSVRLFLPWLVKRVPLSPGTMEFSLVQAAVKVSKTTIRYAIQPSWTLSYQQNARSPGGNWCYEFLLALSIDKELKCDPCDDHIRRGCPQCKRYPQVSTRNNTTASLFHLPRRCFQSSSCCSCPQALSTLSRVGRNHEVEI